MKRSDFKTGEWYKFDNAFIMFIKFAGFGEKGIHENGLPFDHTHKLCFSLSCDGKKIYKGDWIHASHITNRTHRVYKSTSKKLQKLELSYNFGI